MKIPQRCFKALAAALAICLAFPLAARAQTWPNRPVRIVVTFIAGGANDIIARLLAQALSERLGQPFIVENRVGGGGNIGAESVMRSAPDGHTLLQTNIAHATNASLYESPGFNFIRDSTPVAGIYDVPLVLVVDAAFPAKSIPEFIAYAKANAGKISYGSGGIGTLAHVAGELFKMTAGANMVHVPYRGSPASLSDLFGGRIEAVFDPLPTSLEYIRAGKLRALAVTSQNRSPSLPEIPAMGEYLPGYAAGAWSGISAPKAIPADVVQRLNQEINAVLADPAMKGRLEGLGASPLSLSPAGFGKLISDDTEKWAAVIKSAGIRLE